MRNPSKKSYQHHPDRKLLRVEYGPHLRYLPPALAADLAGVSLQTVYKWIAGTHPMDRRTRLVLYTRALGLLPDHRWREWHIDETGRLTAPNGWSFHPDELMAFTYQKQLNAELQARVARLEVDNRMLREALDYAQANRWPGNVVPLRTAVKKAGH
ncbi:DUF3653 domain-containing protein [Marinobacter sp. LN3S78]|uniref:DUF3653 domain-containing protein n=1 Tax=Marinobacter sp. LN3S78 TaxID=3382300 RepID=UPI00387AA331